MDVYQEILKKYWGYDAFRPLQLDIIRSVAAGRDTLGLMPTGGGKSLTFQVPALAMEGLCLVVTPLVALMKDQVEHLRAMGIRAACIHSGLSQGEIIETFDNCLYGDYKFLYISPERLGTRLFQERLASYRISLLVVDEAHCISQWGYDFRPSYLQIARIRELLPEVPVLAVTATATPQVVTDIQQQLHFREPNVFQVSFERKNLAYVVRQTEDKDSQLLGWLENVPGTAIVYVRMRSRTREIASFLKKNGLSADYYHAGLSQETRNERQQAWKSGRTRIIVSTNAFGMGIDKADVRLVLHYDLPDSPEAYFQEAGRAGRDGKKAYAVLLFHKSDATQLKRRISDTFPDKKYIRKVYDSLCYYYELPAGAGEGLSRIFDLTDFCTRFHLNANQAFGALKVLQQAGYLEYTDEQDAHSRLCITMDRDELYQLEVDELGDELLQMLLRSYSGLFADFVPIDEAVLAGHLGCSREQVYHGLKKLVSYGVLQYIPRRTSPLLTFTQDRVEGKDLHLSPEVYELRRRRFEERIMAMVEYASDNSVCRSRRLMHYFGQQKAGNCGQCDVCLRKQGRLRHYEVEDISAAILGALQDRPLSLEDLIDTLGGDKDKTIEVLRFMCEQHRLREDNFLYYPCEESH